MTSIRWTGHALKNLVDRKIDRIQAERVISDPEIVQPDPPNRTIHMRRYFDEGLEQEMLLRVVVEPNEAELVIVTLYKTSQFARYLKGFLR